MDIIFSIITYSLYSFLSVAAYLQLLNMRELFKLYSHVFYNRFYVILSAVGVPLFELILAGLLSVCSDTYLILVIIGTFFSGLIALNGWFFTESSGRRCLCFGSLSKFISRKYTIFVAIAVVLTSAVAISIILTQHPDAIKRYSFIEYSSTIPNITYYYSLSLLFISILVHLWSETELFETGTIERRLQDGLLPKVEARKLENRRGEILDLSMMRTSKKGTLVAFLSLDCAPCQLVMRELSRAKAGIEDLVEVKIIMNDFSNAFPAFDFEVEDFFEDRGREFEEMVGVKYHPAIFYWSAGAGIFASAHNGIECTNLIRLIKTEVRNASRQTI